jgi:hypothetical protein
MKVKVLQQVAGERTFAVVFEKDEDAIEGLLLRAEE